MEVWSGPTGTGGCWLSPRWPHPGIQMHLRPEIQCLWSNLIVPRGFAKIGQRLWRGWNRHLNTSQGEEFSVYLTKLWKKTQNGRSKIAASEFGSFFLLSWSTISGRILINFGVFRSEITARKIRPLLFHMVRNHRPILAHLLRKRE